MSSGLPYGSNTLVIPFSLNLEPSPGRTSEERYRYGVAPQEGSPDDPRRSIAPVPNRVPTS